jgi:glutathione S-transferase
MIKIHGVAISNYYSTAKVALIEKGIPYEDVSIMPSEEPEVLAASPMGKVPYLDVDGSTLSETNVIFDYLEEVQPQPALYPSDPWARAKTKEIIRSVELYLDTPARRHLPTVYFGAAVNQTASDEVRPAVEKGLRAFQQLAQFSPYVAGDTFTFADITTYFQVRFTNLHMTKIYNWDITDSVSGLAAYLEMLGQRPSINAVDTAMQQGFAKLLPK